METTKVSPFFRPSPNELERLKKKEIEKRRLIRLAQVRHQANEYAAKIRHAFQVSQELEIHKLAKQIQQAQYEEDAVTLENLRQEYARCVASLGAAHENAEKETVEKTKTHSAHETAMNQRKAVHRFQLALDTHREREMERRRPREERIYSRQIALETEKERARRVAALPRPKSPPYLLPHQEKELLRLAAEQNPAPLVTVYDHTSSPWVHIEPVPASVHVQRHQDDDSIPRHFHDVAPSTKEDAWMAADREAERLEQWTQSKEAEAEKRAAKATSRGREAHEKEVVRRHYEHVLGELETHQRDDAIRRQRIFHHIPAQIFAMPHQLAKEKRRAESAREKVFEAAVIEAYEKRARAAAQEQILVAQERPPTSKPESPKVVSPVEEVDSSKLVSSIPLEDVEKETEHESRDDFAAVSTSPNEEDERLPGERPPLVDIGEVLNRLRRDTSSAVASTSTRGAVEIKSGSSRSNSSKLQQFEAQCDHIDRLLSRADFEREKKRLQDELQAIDESLITVRTKPLSVESHQNVKGVEERAMSEQAKWLQRMRSKASPFKEDDPPTYTTPPQTERPRPSPPVPVQPMSTATSSASQQPPQPSAVVTEKESLQAQVHAYLQDAIRRLQDSKSLLSLPPATGAPPTLPREQLVELPLPPSSEKPESSNSSHASVSSLGLEHDQTEHFEQASLGSCEALVLETRNKLASHQRDLDEMKDSLMHQFAMQVNAAQRERLREMVLEQQREANEAMLEECTGAGDMDQTLQFEEPLIIAHNNAELQDAEETLKNLRQYFDEVRMQEKTLFEKSVGDTGDEVAASDILERMVTLNPAAAMQEHMFHHDLSVIPEMSYVERPEVSSVSVTTEINAEETCKVPQRLTSNLHTSNSSSPTPESLAHVLMTSSSNTLTQQQQVTSSSSQVTSTQYKELPFRPSSSVSAAVEAATLDSFSSGQMFGVPEETRSAKLPPPLHSSPLPSQTCRDVAAGEEEVRTDKRVISLFSSKESTISSGSAPSMNISSSTSLASRQEILRRLILANEDKLLAYLRPAVSTAPSTRDTSLESWDVASSGVTPPLCSGSTSYHEYSYTSSASSHEVTLSSSLITDSSSDSSPSSRPSYTTMKTKPLPSFLGPIAECDDVGFTQSSHFTDISVDTQPFPPGSSRSSQCSSLRTTQQHSMPSLTTENDFVTAIPMKSLYTRVGTRSTNSLLHEVAKILPLSQHSSRPSSMLSCSWKSSTHTLASSKSASSYRQAPMHDTQAQLSLLSAMAIPTEDSRRQMLAAADALLQSAMKERGILDESQLSLVTAGTSSLRGSVASLAPAPVPRRAVSQTSITESLRSFLRCEASMNAVRPPETETDDSFCHDVASEPLSPESSSTVSETNLPSGSVVPHEVVVCDKKMRAAKVKEATMRTQRLWSGLEEVKQQRQLQSRKQQQDVNRERMKAYGQKLREQQQKKKPVTGNGKKEGPTQPPGNNGR